MEFKHLIIIILILFFITSVNAYDSNKKLDIVGSSSVQPVCEKLVNVYSDYNDIDIDVQGGGSALGINSVSNDVCEIGMASMDVDDCEIIKHEIASEAIIIIVNPSNPVNDLSSSQIRDIFSGKIKNWDDISNKSGKINLLVREEGSGTLDVFKKVIMKNDSIKSDAIVQNSAGSIKQTVSLDENAISFVSLCHLDSSLKEISIDGIYPNNETILDNSYKLQRPFLLLTNKTPSQDTVEFINWTKSSEACEILTNESLVVGQID